MRKESKYNKSLIDLAEVLLEDNKTLSIRMNGLSMYPALQHGDTGMVKKCFTDELKIGDIVVWRSDNLLVAHRLISCERKDNGWRLLTRGDNNLVDDIPFSEKELAGKLISFERNGKTYTQDDIRMKIFRFNSMHNHKLTVRMNRIYLRIIRIFPYLKSQSNSLLTNIRQLTPGSEKQFRTNAVLAVLKGLVSLAMIVCIKYLIDFLSHSSLETAEQKGLFFLLLGTTALLFLASGLLSQISNYTGEKLSQSVSRRVYDQLHRKHIRLHYADFENSEKLDKMHRAVQEASYRPVRILNSALGFIKTVSAGVLLLAVFVSIRWYLLLILLAAVMPEALFRITYVRRLYRMKESQVAAEREKYYYNRVLTGFPFAKELRLFDFAGYFLRLFNRKQDDLFEEKLALTRYETRYSILAQIVAVLLIFASLGIVSYLKIRGVMSIGTVVLFFFAFQRGYAILNEFFRSIASLIEDNTFLEDFLGFIQSPDTASDVVDAPKPFILKKEILFENVTFRYNDSERDALKNVSIRIPAGKTVALVGENGAGKTTLVKLLCGFYPPTEGQILIDGVRVEQIGQKEILKNTTAVFQDFALYQVSALDNILLGNVRATPDAAKAKEAAAIAGIAEALEKLPRGYETRLGHLFKESEELSIGQWQKMALARAFYRDAPLLLMDEPSSALDANSERRIIKSLQHLAENKTTLIVSHHLSTVQWADQIYLLDRGEVAETGTHEELMKMEGKYFHLFRTSRER